MRVARAGSLAGAAAVTLLAASGAVTATAPATTPPTALRPLSTLASRVVFPHPPTIAECRAVRTGRACYGPPQFQAAYNMTGLYSSGLDGRGKTIVIVDSFGSPTIKHDLAVFDKAYGLPAPPRFDIIQPAGKVHVDIKNADQGGWGEETTLDVEYAHAMAPGANILLVETPVAETEGLVGIPEIVKAENYVISHHLGDVITQSFGATEETFPTAQALLRQRSAFQAAAAARIPVLASSGDAGVTDAKWSGEYYPRRVNSWPSSDPLVTSVGGTEVHLNQRGVRTSPDTVWNQTSFYGDAVAGGSGLSHIFARPAFQNPVAKLVGKHRGTPDISLSASTNGGAIVYIGFTSPAAGVTGPGWYVFGGTSLASPLFSGVVAVAEQAAGRNLGPLNPALYNLGRRGAAGIPDITRGNTTVTFTRNGKPFTVKGYPAKHGYDLASGLGTVNGGPLVRELAR